MENSEAIFWCRVPAKTRLMSTLVWNPSTEILLFNIKINESLISEIKVQDREYKVIESKNSGKRHRFEN